MTKRTKSLTLICIFLLASLPILMPTFIKEAQATEMPKSTVATGRTYEYSSGYSIVRRLFYAVGRYWVFYSNGIAETAYNAPTNMAWKTSTDNVTWSSETAISALGYAHTAESIRNDIYHLEGTNYTFLAFHAADYFYLRRGTLYTNGSIAWGSTEQLYAGTTSGVGSEISLRRDANNYIWFVAEHSYRLQFWRSNGVNGTGGWSDRKSVV